VVRGFHAHKVITAVWNYTYSCVRPGVCFVPIYIIILRSVRLMNCVGTRTGGRPRTATYIVLNILLHA